MSLVFNKSLGKYTLKASKLKTPLKKGQGIIRDYLRSVLTYFKVAFGTYYYAIVGFLTAFFYRNAWYGEPIICLEGVGISSTPSTRESHALPIVLSPLSLVNSVAVESHGNLPHSSLIWREYAIEDYCFQLTLSPKLAFSSP